MGEFEVDVKAVGMSLVQGHKVPEVSVLPSCDEARRALKPQSANTFDEP